jgi:hypothetical protein
MTLPIPETPVPAPDSPLDLYERLQVTEPGLTDLWLHQGNALRRYHQEHLDHRDVALELPTGAGKTLVGLLIAEWRRLAMRQPVAYACLNNQLAEQVASKAAGYGIDVVLLTGKKDAWPPLNAAAFRAGDAIAITNYNHVFNYWSGLDEASTLVFDDAHGGEDAVADTWSITVSREREPGLFSSLVGAVGGALSPPFSSLLAQVDIDPREQGIEMVPPTALPERVEQLRDALASGIVSKSHNDFALRAIGQHLERCLVYCSPREVLIRPFIPPTRDLSHVYNADQRLYMSATLGTGGELERAFGVDRVRRIPAEVGQQRSGRRLLLMPGLRIDEAPADEMIRNAIASTPRTAIIAPSSRALQSTADVLLDPGTTRRGPGEIAAFIQEQPSALLLANRYDGIDLPDEQCRLIILSGLPAFGHSQERFLFETVGAERVLRERIRTRIIQGAGRATRNRQDFAAVILRGEDLLRFVQRQEGRGEMRPELQVELELGESYSRDTNVDLLEALGVFWEHGEGWQPIESYLRDQVAARQRIEDPVSTALGAAAPHEVHAWWSCWQGDLQSAVDAAMAAVAQLVGEPLRAYRAIWEYFAASWAATLSTQTGEPSLAQAAASLRTSAETTARMLRWFPRFQDGPQALPIGPQHDARAERLTDWIRRLNTRRRRFQETITTMREQLASRDPTTFHQGIETLGLALGFSTWRDDGRPACPDGAWRDNGKAWVLFEAKTLQGSENPVPTSDIRQANSHDNWIEAEEAWRPRPERLLTVIVSPRETLGDAVEVVADPDVTLVEPQVLEAIADQAMSALAHLRGLPATLSDVELAIEASAELTRRGLDTISLFATLGSRMLRSSQV